MDSKAGSWRRSYLICRIMCLDQLGHQNTRRLSLLRCKASTIRDPTLAGVIPCWSNEHQPEATLKFTLHSCLRQAKYPGPLPGFELCLLRNLILRITLEQLHIEVTRQEVSR